MIIKKRNWAFVLYPESAPENWLEILQLSGVSGCISPLHDKDLNATNEDKKPHYHVILSYGNPTTYTNVLNLTKETLKGTIPQALETVRGYYRYLTHADNPEKYQYSEKDIVSFNGFDYLSVVELTNDTIRLIKKAVVNFVIENNIFEYSDLVLLLLTEDKIAWFDVVINNTLFFDRFISSRRNSFKDNLKKRSL